MIPGRVLPYHHSSSGFPGTWIFLSNRVRQTRRGCGLTKNSTFIDGLSVFFTYSVLYSPRNPFQLGFIISLDFNLQIEMKNNCCSQRNALELLLWTFFNYPMWSPILTCLWVYRELLRSITPSDLYMTSRSSMTRRVLNISETCNILDGKIFQYTSDLELSLWAFWKGPWRPCLGTWTCSHGFFFSQKDGQLSVKNSSFKFYAQPWRIFVTRIRSWKRKFISKNKGIL